MKEKAMEEIPRSPTLPTEDSALISIKYLVACQGVDDDKP